MWPGLSPQGGEGVGLLRIFQEAFSHLWRQQWSPRKDGSSSSSWEPSLFQVKVKHFYSRHRAVPSTPARSQVPQWPQPADMGVTSMPSTAPGQRGVHPTKQLPDEGGTHPALGAQAKPVCESGSLWLTRDKPTLPTSCAGTISPCCPQDLAVAPTPSPIPSSPLLQADPSWPVPCPEHQPTPPSEPSTQEAAMWLFSRR